MATSTSGPRDRCSAMKFGACSLLSGGGVVFRLWAPTAEQVDLCLMPQPGAKQEVLPMARAEAGWFMARHQAAKAGDLYQFIINKELAVPDPASRYQAKDIHGPSLVCNPEEYVWHDQAWPGRAWQETVIYELHIGAFSPRGNFLGVIERLDYLADLGITAIELMPIGQFPGRCNWGYDGALLFAPCNSYGRPEDLKRLVDEAHARGLMVFLDVVYNHFGPEGNYLASYAAAFFTEEFHTPWGAAINFAGSQSRIVRDFFIANALYWLEEFHLDGLRFDAVHSIFDQSAPDILEEIAQMVQSGPGRERYIHLILENDHNCARYLARESGGTPRHFTAQWNDDFHHACHVLLTGEQEGYYQDYSDNPLRHLGRCLSEGFAYQGEKSSFREGRQRGEPSAHLPPLAFVSFLQNHDQIGNRALGERLVSLCDPRDLEIIVVLLLLAPSPPLLFMGEEFGARNPFYFFCDFGPQLAADVTRGRRREFQKFAQFSSPESREQIPDPNAAATFAISKLDWQTVDAAAANPALQLYKKLLQLRQQEIVPRLPAIQKGGSGFRLIAEKSLKAWWLLATGDTLSVIFNLHDRTLADNSALPARLIYQHGAVGGEAWSPTVIAPKSIVWFMEEPEKG